MKPAGPLRTISFRRSGIASPLSTVIATIVLTAGVTTGCRTTERPPSTAVTVLAAASMTNAVTEAAERFQETTGIEVRISTGPSNGLARQVLNGAPADVFISASHEWADAVEQQGHAIERRVLLANRLVLIVPEGNPAGIQNPSDLLHDSVSRVALAGEGVPAGRYAEEALRSLDLWKALQRSGKIVRGHDVRLTLGFVERGEAEAGIVYATDAAVTDRTAIVHKFDPQLHGPIEYPLVLLDEGPAGSDGQRFYEFLAMPEAQSIFQRHGFLPAASTRAER